MILQKPFQPGVEIFIGALCFGYNMILTGFINVQ